MMCEKCRTPLRPVVALDVDGTLADYHGHFICFALQWLRRIGGEELVVEKYHQTNDLAAALGINKEVYRTIKLAYRQGGQKRFQPSMGPVGMLFDRIHRAGCDIWITTTRPYNRFDSTDPDTREWLDYQANGVPYEGLIYDDNKYEVLRDILGVDRVALVVDDLAGNCVASQRIGFPTVQYKNRYNTRALWEGEVANNFEEVMQWLGRSLKHHDHR